VDIDSEHIVLPLEVGTGVSPEVIFKDEMVIA